MKLKYILPIIILAVIITPRVAAQLIAPPTISEIGSLPDQNGYRQIFYLENGTQKFITSHNYPSVTPQISEDYITWMSQINGLWQIFLYHIPSASVIQLTSFGNNTNPRISADKVVWERWIEDAWQIMYFDGTRISQITQGDTSQTPDISGDFIAFDRYDKQTNLWRTVSFTPKTGKSVDIKLSLKALEPKFSGRSLSLRDETDGHRTTVALDINNLFLLDLSPLALPDQPTTVSAEQILQEINTP